MRCWVKVNGFLFDLNSSLDGKLLAENRLVWVYEIPSRENQQFVDELHVIAEIRDGKNAVDFWFHFETEQPSVVAEITVRFDLEDRSFHGKPTWTIPQLTILDGQQAILKMVLDLSFNRIRIGDWRLGHIAGSTMPRRRFAEIFRIRSSRPEAKQRRAMRTARVGLLFQSVTPKWRTWPS